MYFEIAGLTIKLLSDIPLEKIKLSERILSFCVPDRNLQEDVEIRVKDKAKVFFPFGDLVYDSGDILKMYGKNYVY